MPAFDELVTRYKKRRHDTLVDAVTVGLSLADEVSEDLGILEDTGLASELLDTVSNALPFAVIAVSEQYKVLLGKKTAAAGAGDTAYRMLRTGAAMGIGAAAAAAGGALVALPSAVAARVLLDRCRSQMMTGYRVAQRTLRLRALRASKDREDRAQKTPSP